MHNMHVNACKKEHIVCSMQASKLQLANDNGSMLVQSIVNQHLHCIRASTTTITHRTSALIYTRPNPCSITIRILNHNNIYNKTDFQLFRKPFNLPFAGNEEKQTDQLRYNPKIIHPYDIRHSKCLSISCDTCPLVLVLAFSPIKFPSSLPSQLCVSVVTAHLPALCVCCGWQLISGLIHFG